MFMSTTQKVISLKVMIHLAALLPIINLYVQAVTEQLGADPVEVVIHFTGIGAFNLLLLTLSVTPLAQYFRLPYVMQTRRLLGLYVFAYALLHLLNFVAFDLQFEFSLLLSEIIERPYITVGMIALLLLTALAITSIAEIRRRMGRHWQKLHNAIYLILLLVALHFYWSVKSEMSTPILYFAVSLILLSVRYKKFGRWFRG
jgi:methionine sulfoxide reductase heme-binding subunit